jgi:hypothetical protein
MSQMASLQQVADQKTLQHFADLAKLHFPANSHGDYREYRHVR